MEGFRILEIKKSVFENNDREAENLRKELKKDRTFLLNLMSSPGSGKTTFAAWLTRRALRQSRVISWCQAHPGRISDQAL